MLSQTGSKTAFILMDNFEDLLENIIELVHCHRNGYRISTLFCLFISSIQADRNSFYTKSNIGNQSRLLFFIIVDVPSVARYCVFIH